MSGGGAPGVFPDGGRMGLVIGAVALVSVALELTGGTLHPVALGLVTVGVLVAAASVFRTPRAEEAGASWLPAALLASMLFTSLVLDLTRAPCIYCAPGSLRFFHLSILAAAALGATYAWAGAPPWLRSVRFSALLLVGLAAGAAIILASPAPRIDTWLLRETGAASLWQGSNPYAAPSRNIYGPSTQFLSPALLSPDGWWITTNPYTPITFLLDGLGLPFGDVRWATLLAIVASAWLIRRLGRGSIAGELAALLVLLNPVTFFVLEQGWTEPYVLAFLLATGLAVAGRAQGPGVGPAEWLLPAAAGGLALATKQYVPLLALPFLFLVPRRSRWRAAGGAAVLAIGIAIPFVAWSPGAFLKGFVEYQIVQPFRMDALSWPAQIAVLGGSRMPAWPAFVAAGLLLAFGMRRAFTVTAGFVLAATAWLLFIVLSKQAFCNYYWLAAALLLASVAAEAGRGAQDPGSSREAPDGRRVRPPVADAVSPPRPWGAAALGFAAYVPAAAILVGALLFKDFPYGFFELTDVGLYHQRAMQMARGLRPYVDFVFEYPPAAMWVIAFPGHPVRIESYALAFAGLMLTCLGGVAAAVAVTAAQLWGRWREVVVASAAFALSVLALGAVVANRYDATVALSLVVFVWAAATRRWVIAGLALGAGAALKLVPAIFLPLALVLPMTTRERARLLAASGAAFLVPAVVSGEAVAAMRTVATYHGTRPLQIESVPGSLFLLLKLTGLADVKVVNAFGSQGLEAAGASLVAGASGPLAAVCLALVLWWTWRSRRAIRSDPRLIALAATATLLAVMVPSKVLSPQYLVWLLPLIALLVPVARGLAVVLFLALVATHIEFPAMYWALARLEAMPIAVVVARNLLLVGAFVVSTVRLARLGAPPPP